MILFYVLIVILSILCAAFFSGSEIGLVSIDQVLLDKEVKEKKRNAAELKKIVSRPERFLATMLVGNNLAIVTTSSFATTIALLLSKQFLLPPALTDTVIGIIISANLLMFGEIIPKILFSQSPLKSCLRFTYGLTIVDRIFSPFVTIVTWISKYPGKGKHTQKKLPKISRDELKMMFKYAPDGLTGEQKGDFIENIFELGELKCHEILMPRVDLEGLPKTATYEEVLDFVTEWGFTRIPIFEGNLDKIVGVLCVKSLLKNYHDEEWQKYIEKACFIPENKKVLDLFAEMKTSGSHFAIVFDEYGGTEGIITLEDILEEIVGEIDDEFDEKKGIGRKLPEGSFIIKGNAETEEVNDNFELQIPRENDYTTINGWILNYLGRIPRTQEKFNLNGYKIVVIKADPRKIIEIKLKHDSQK